MSFLDKQLHYMTDFIIESEWNGKKAAGRTRRDFIGSQFFSQFKTAFTAEANALQNSFQNWRMNLTLIGALHVVKMMRGAKYWIEKCFCYFNARVKIRAIVYDVIIV